MIKENINSILKEKINNEMKEFEGWLINQSPKVIVKYANEYTVKKDICEFIKENSIQTNLAKALYEAESSLDAAFIEYNKRNTYRMYDIGQSVEIAANKLAISQNKRKEM